MSPNEYQTAAMRTASMGLGRQVETAVRGLGLCGESAEFLATPTLDEAGDVLWYVATVAEAAGLDMDTVIDHRTFNQFQTAWALPRRPDVDPAELMMRHACLLADHIKKFVGHGKPLDPMTVESRLHWVLAYLSQALSARQMGLEAAAEGNVSKLQARYPQGFKPADAPVCGAV